MLSTSKTRICPLCKSDADWFCDYFNTVVDFFRCRHCLGIFKTPDNFPDSSFEKERYETHNNDVYDERYQKFVSPITNAVKKEFDVSAKGLDYGCGTGPVAAFILEKGGYNIKLFDPYFYPNEQYLNNKYDYIICCEVMEHFFYPDKEFLKLKSLLKSDSKLYCKTKMISDDIGIEDFKDWHYKNDPTHVFFYTPKSLQAIRHFAKFKSVNFDDNLIIFKT